MPDAGLSMNPPLLDIYDCNLPSAAQFGSYASIDDLSVIPSTNKPTTTKSVNNGQAAQPNKANPFNQFPSTTRKPNAGNNKDWPMFSNMNQVKPGQPFQMDSPPKNNNGGQKCGTRVKRQSSSVTKDGTHVRNEPDKNLRPRATLESTGDYHGPVFALYDKSFVEDGEEVILNCPDLNPRYTNVPHDKQIVVWSKGKEAGDKILENGTPNESEFKIKSEFKISEDRRTMTIPKFHERNINYFCSVSYDGKERVNMYQFNQKNEETDSQTDTIKEASGNGHNRQPQFNYDDEEYD
uniref:Ig-like domain-containing protein n=1 Tax=Romanomermis culicivorax TaxID=13658 RepID=A0A915J0N0_ROMCU